MEVLMYGFQGLGYMKFCRGKVALMTSIPLEIVSAI